MTTYAPHRCARTGKVKHSSARAAHAAGHTFARELRERGEFAEPLYAYECSHCGDLHLTRLERYLGGPLLRQVYNPPTLDAQLWAMPPHLRRAARDGLPALAARRREMRKRNAPQ